ncbi:MAG: hypothetical protein WEF50_23375 [Myxococcota bacterium]
MTELRRHVAELDARREKLRCERVAQVLRAAVPNVGCREDAPPLEVAERAQVALYHVRLAARPLAPPVESEERATESPREVHAPRAAALRRSGLTTAGPVQIDEQRAPAVMVGVAPGDPAPSKPEHLADAKSRVQQEQDEGVRLEPLSARGRDELLHLARPLDRPHVAARVALGSPLSGARLAREELAEVVDWVARDQAELARVAEHARERVEVVAAGLRRESPRVDGLCPPRAQLRLAELVERHAAEPREDRTIGTERTLSLGQRRRCESRRVLLQVALREIAELRCLGAHG